MDVHPIVRQIINRDCHVSESNVSVIKHVIGRLRNGYGTFKLMPPEDRKDLLKQCVHQHKRNLEEYASVMGGGWGFSG